MSGFETILVETDADGIATVTLNRPDKHHAMNAAMIAELTEAAATLGAEPQVRAVVLAATGPSFCAGGDLEWMRAQQAADRAGKIAEAGKLSAMLAALNALPKPLIARVQGNVYGGGVGLVAASDIAIGADGIKLALTETRLGLIPATNGPLWSAAWARGWRGRCSSRGSPSARSSRCAPGSCTRSAPPRRSTTGCAGRRRRCRRPPPAPSRRQGALHGARRGRGDRHPHLDRGARRLLGKRRGAGADRRVPRVMRRPAKRNGRNA
jgi:methylglutaconyl-CoA hydratase